MPPRRTYYEVLGVAPTAPLDDIKRQYRRLAKRYHPDVAGAADPADAHAAFVRITEAYDILSDPARREAYDRELRLAERSRADSTAAPANPSRAAAGPAAPRPAAQAQARPDVSRRLVDARLNFMRGRWREALAACEEIARLDPKNAAVYSLMGDIHRALSHPDDAIHAYTMAVQLNPDSPSDMAKLNALFRREERSTHVRERVLPQAQRATAAIGWVVVGLLLLLPRIYKGNRVGFWPVTEWTDNLLLGMLVTAFLVGFLVTMTGFVSRMDDEFLSSSVRSGHGGVPVGLLVGVAAILFFPLAVAYYLVVVAMAETSSRSMVRVLVLTAAEVALFALTVPDAAVQTLVFGGNVVFPCMVMGSFAGGFFREPW